MKKLLYAFCVLCSGCSPIDQEIGLEDDNVMEEGSEYLIRKYMGLDVDLTPESKE